jgi:alpha-L-fucosidase
VRGQVEELLTNYGRIDLLWFDGKPAVPNPTEIIPIARIRELQPWIVVNPRLHSKGDYITYERTLGTDVPAKTWAEFCNTWTSSWSHQELPFRSNAFILGQLAKCRSLGVNYLLGVGPTKDGVFCDDIYKNMAVVADWMKKNGPSVKGVTPLPASEKATADGKTVPATASKTARYLFAVPEFNGGMMDSDMVAPGEVTFELKGVSQPTAVKLLGDDGTLAFTYEGDTLKVTLPADKRTRLVDVVQVQLK